MKNSLSSYVRNTALRPAGLSRGSSSSEAFWNAPFSLSNSSIFSPVKCWNTRGFVLASSYFISFPPLPSFYSLLHAFPINFAFAEVVGEGPAVERRGRDQGLDHPAVASQHLRGGAELPAEVVIHP